MWWSHRRRDAERLSKWLLRQGLLYDGAAWTGAYESWLRSPSFDRLGVRLAFDEAHDTVLTILARRYRASRELLVLEPRHHGLTTPPEPLVGDQPNAGSARGRPQRGGHGWR